MLETNKQTLLFNSVILRYKLRDLIQMYDDFVNDPIKRDFQKISSLFQIGRKSLAKYKLYRPIPHVKFLAFHGN